MTALKRLKLSQVWWIVTPGNPLKDNADLAPLAERIAASRGLPSTHVSRLRRSRPPLAPPTRRDTRLFLRAFSARPFRLAHGSRQPRELASLEGLAVHMNLMPIAVEDRPGWRYRALSSPAAHSFARFRVPEAAAGRLAALNPPAWVYLSGPLSKLSSTALRIQGYESRANARYAFNLGDSLDSSCFILKKLTMSSTQALTVSTMWICRVFPSSTSSISLVSADMSVSMKLACTPTTRVPWWCSSRRTPLVSDHSAALEAP